MLFKMSEIDDCPSVGLTIYSGSHSVTFFRGTFKVSNSPASIFLLLHEFSVGIFIDEEIR